MTGAVVVQPRVEKPSISILQTSIGRSVDAPIVGDAAVLHDLLASWERLRLGSEGVVGPSRRRGRNCLAFEPDNEVILPQHAQRTAVN